MGKQSVLFRDLGLMDYQDSLGLPGIVIAGKCKTEVGSQEPC